jgi:hypothetical protein
MTSVGEPVHSGTLAGARQACNGDDRRPCVSRAHCIVAQHLSLHFVPGLCPDIIHDDWLARLSL